jgi:FG-GAP repeat protein/VCBS repeat protein/all-beta uncharacterized protein/BACON domain-containing protein
MVTNFRRIAVAGLAMALSLPTLANAQDISLANGGTDQTWKGSQPGANAGAWMDLGDLSGDARRDLIIGAPGNASIAGKVYVIFGGPDRTGEFNLSTADVIISSSEAGNQFGLATAAGNVTTPDGSNPKNLVIGAPAALGGRGAVYLYTTNWGVGTRLTQANAILTILGAPGDQLGFALATGDLDKDGRREIIIGAPGNNRLYIIKGSSTLAGTIDLSTTAAAATFSAAGIGKVLIAGDITGDGIYDVLAGAPSQNLVFGLIGATGTIPTGAAMAFFGANPGDEAGSAIRLLDLDDDGITDLVIGAPGGDGPANGRTNAGNVYLYYGPLTPGARNLSGAHVVFYGASPNLRAGQHLATGDINRDTPNDLVILAPGGSGGAGELDIYYGRQPRTEIGTGTSPRVVDLAVAGQVNRRILGDPGAGAIASAQVYEVTGEGARDIIVGAPTVEGTGKLYFTISPRLKITRTTESLVANKGGTATSTTPVGVTNPSVVSTGWQATANVPWLSASPASGSIVQTSPGAFYVVGSTATLNGGVYTGTIQVKSTSPDLFMSLPVDVTFTVTDARLAIDIPAANATVSNGFSIAGWAVDISSPTGTGVTSVEGYAFPVAGGAPIYLGTAAYGGARSDIGNLFGSRFTNSGYSLQIRNLTPGATYHVGAFVKSSVTGAIAVGKAVTVTVASGSPAAGPTPPDPNPAPAPTDPTLGPAPGPGPGPGPTPGPDTRVATNRSSLTFGAINNGTVHSAGQTVIVSFTNGAGTWTASADAAWLTLSPASGSGAGSFKVSMVNGSYPAGQSRTATVTITAPGVANSPLRIPVSLQSFTVGAPPAGLVDTPNDNATGVVGAVPVTGWAVDDIGISQVTIWRDPIAGEAASSANGKVFVGTAAQVEGARPDIDATYNMPGDSGAGWGYMLLTNMLPNQGNGTFRLYAFADDLDGHSIQLGSRTITCDNAHAVKPFGSIDTPDQGGSVSGAQYVNFGWALTPQPNSIPVDGSTITVFIDGVPVGHPSYNHARDDIATLFPGRANSGGPVGFFILNTTALANGVHTIAWGVVDGAGHAEGIGSRFFSVLNGAAASTLSPAAVTPTSIDVMPDAPLRQGAAAVGESVGQPVTSLETAPIVEQPAYVQSGFTTNAPTEMIETEAFATARVKTEELGLVRVTIGSPVSGDQDGYEGYMVKGSELAALPAGSFLDKRTGEFFWQPGPGFVGSYDFVFVRTGNGARTRTPLSVDIAPQKHDNEEWLPSRAIRVIK